MLERTRKLVLSGCSAKYPAPYDSMYRLELRIIVSKLDRGARADCFRAGRPRPLLSP